MNGSTFPGRMISWAAAVCFGETTDTGVIATCDVSVRNVLPARMRDRIPHARRAAATISAIARINQRRDLVVPNPASLDGREISPILLPTSICCDIVTPIQKIPSYPLPLLLTAWRREPRRTL